MSDHLSKRERSWNMGRIRSQDTKPEIALRSALHKSGLRFRIHVKELPGKPDIVLRKYSAVIMVHGCFWHGHRNCRRGNIPKTNTEYWAPKITGNIARDAANAKRLESLGWKVATVWECEIVKLDQLVANVKLRLGMPSPA